MRYSQAGPEIMFIDGPQVEFQLMGQGLTALRIDTEADIDKTLGSNSLWSLDEIDDTLSRLPRVELDPAAAAVADYMPERGMNIKLHELEMTCNGLRIARRATRLHRVTLGVPTTPEIISLAQHLAAQAEAYQKLHADLDTAKSNWR